MNQLTSQQQGYNAISHALQSKQTTNRICNALGIDPNDDKAIAEAMPYASSVKMEIERNFGDGSKDMSTCQPESIVQCVVDAARYKLMIDGRQHAYLIKYGNKATLQIGYRGFLHKIKAHFPDACIHYKQIMEGDTFEISSEDGYDTYKHQIADALNDEYEKVKGVYVAISYKVGDKNMQAVTVMSKKMIDRVKSSANTSTIWNKWYIEKAIAACIKRACKVHFASIKELHEVINYDNSATFTPYNNRAPDVDTQNPFETMNQIKLEKQQDSVTPPNVVAVEGDEAEESISPASEPDLLLSLIHI